MATFWATFYSIWSHWLWYAQYGNPYFYFYIGYLKWNLWWDQSIERGARWYHHHHHHAHERPQQQHRHHAHERPQQQHRQHHFNTWSNFWILKLAWFAQSNDCRSACRLCLASCKHFFRQKKLRDKKEKKFWSCIIEPRRNGKNCRFRKSNSKGVVTRWLVWPDDYIICSIFGHLIINIHPIA